ncbi:MAG TPA: hypothetical protein VIT20_10465 [Propionibacteriaceae bacterium]
MRIAFLVNDVGTEKAIYTTTLLARTAAQRGHDVHYLDLVGLSVQPGGEVLARTRRAPGPGCDLVEFLASVQQTPPRTVDVGELDVLMIRSEPSFELETRAWAQPISWQFGELARLRGVLVLSDPRGLALAGPDKYYSLKFPSRLRPATLVTRDLEAVRTFAADREHGMVLKPLHGGAGESVFWVRPDDPNLAQVFAAVARRGYVIAQDYLPAISEGTIRLFMLAGEPLRVDGRVAALHHLQRGSDIRTNYAVAATVVRAEVGDDTLTAAAAVGEILAEDGMFLVGLDLVGDQILEANLHSPGGLPGAQRTCRVDFAAGVVDAMVARRQTTTGRI